MLNRLKRKFSEVLPGWLLAFVVVFYYALHPHRKKILIVPHDNAWLIMDRDSKFLSPSPKLWGVLDMSEYNRYFRVEYGEVVLDVGACIGGFTVRAARKARFVIAIEPEPKNLAILRANITRNRLQNIQIVEKVAWNRKETLKLYLGKLAGEHSVINDAKAFNSFLRQPSGESMKVQADTLDNIISSLGIEKVDFLKMDIEGAELEALEGADRVLNTVKKVIIAAYHFRNGEKTLPRVRRFLEARGLKVRVDPDDLVYAWRNMYEDKEAIPSPSNIGAVQRNDV